jgi:hypothetical protein
MSLSICAAIMPIAALVFPIQKLRVGAMPPVWHSRLRYRCRGIHSPSNYGWHPGQALVQVPHPPRRPH